MLFVISNNNNKSLLIVDFQKGRPGTFVVKQMVQSDISSLFPQQIADVLQPETCHPPGVLGNLPTLSGTQLFHQ